MEPDAKTFYLLNVFVALLSGGASLAAWLDHRDIPGLRAWAVGLSVGALGAMMLGLCPRDSSCVLTIAAATLIVGGYATLWMGVRQFNEGSLDLRYALVPVIVFLAHRPRSGGRRRGSNPQLDCRHDDGRAGPSGRLGDFQGKRL